MICLALSGWAGGWCCYTLPAIAIEWENDVTALPPIASPCINVCVMDAESRLCTGCGRTIDEIAQWSAMSASRRREVIATLPERIETLGGKAAAPAMALARIRSLLRA